MIRRRLIEMSDTLHVTDLIRAASYRMNESYKGVLR